MSLEQGWQCPVCGTVMGPKERVCIKCSGGIVEHIQVYYDTTINPDNSGNTVVNEKPVDSLSFTANSLIDALDTEFNSILHNRNGAE